eukprot:m.19695 g.19695  ORF g.19695 m.19695 type:complete len:619 (+) comp3717_c0_seq1:88-1944(+)
MSIAMRVVPALLCLVALSVLGLAFTTTRLRHQAQDALRAHLDLAAHGAMPQGHHTQPAASTPPTAATAPMRTSGTLTARTGQGPTTRVRVAVMSSTVGAAAQSVRVPPTSGVTLDGEDACCRLRDAHGVIPGQSWGSLPLERQGWWKEHHCDDQTAAECKPRTGASAGAVTAAIATPCVRDVGTTIDGGDMFAGFYNTKSADDCCKACNLRTDCLAWSFSGGICWRKGAGGHRVRRLGAVSGSRCDTCGALDESLPPCRNATEGSACHRAIERVMTDARQTGSTSCGLRGYGLLPTDPPHAFQSYIYENVNADAQCAPPCLPTAVGVEALGLRPEESPAKSGRLLTVGIPSACRDESQLGYLARRLVHHARSGLGDAVRFTAWQSHSAATNTADRNTLTSLGFTVGVNTAGYPPFAVRTTLGDPPARVRWRSNEALDYARLLNLSYAARTPYVLIVQDDTFAAPDVGKHLREVLAEVSDRNPQFGLVSLYTDASLPRSKAKLYEFPRGDMDPLYYGRAGQAVALLFRREVIPGLCDFISQHFIDAPLDWMIYSYIGHIANDGGGLKVYGYNPNLFQHVGWSSTASFKNKVQGRGKFTSKTFSWMSLSAVEAAIREGTL